jgi:hypothetical protein
VPDCGGCLPALQIKTAQKKAKGQRQSLMAPGGGKGAWLGLKQAEQIFGSTFSSDAYSLMQTARMSTKEREKKSTGAQGKEKTWLREKSLKFT